MIKIKKGKERTQALFLMAVTATLWSLGGILIKSVNTNPMAIAGVRSAIASIVILIAIRKPKFTFSPTQIGATLSYTATVFLFVIATKTTTAANAILLQFTAPIYVAILGAWILKEKTRLIDWIVIVVVLCGMILFFVDNLSTEGMVGNILAALSGISFALFFIFTRMQKNESSMESILLGNILTAIIGLPFLIGATPDTTGWLCLTVLGIVQLGLPYILYSIAIKHATALEAILTTAIEPILNPIWVLIFIGEKPSHWAIIGGIIVIGSVLTRHLIILSKAKRRLEAGCIDENNKLLDENIA
jgi:drug/metabolite transporter (DMT)-like permease